MSNRLLIQYASEDFQQWNWVFLDRHDRPIGKPGYGNLEDLVAIAKGKRLILVVVGRELLITSVDLPESNSRVINSAVPFALEEQMAEDVEDIHFVSGERQSTGLIPVVAISKQFFSNLLGIMSKAGLHPTLVLPEPLLIPWSAGGFSLVVHGDRVIVRNATLSGYECSLSQLPIMVKDIIDQCKEDKSLVIRIWADEGVLDYELLFGVLKDRLVLRPELTLFGLLTESDQIQKELNLLQGFERINTEQIPHGNWWPSIILLFLAIGIYLGTLGYQYYSIQQHLLNITHISETLFRKTFPEVKRLVSPLIQARQKLEQRKSAYGQGTDHLLALLSLVGEAWQKESGINFINMEYRKSHLVVQLEGQSVGQIESFKRRLLVDGDTAAILSTVSRGNKVEARIKIKLEST